MSGSSTRKDWRPTRAANAPMHGHNSIQVRAQMNLLDIKFGSNAEAANFNQEINRAAADALRAFTTNQASSQPAASPGARPTGSSA